ncbi:MAG: hypothetical protein LBJ47_09655, partial [Tannerella sp.]|nr:hypothetical protein [Tannerella sp.]
MRKEVLIFFVILFTVKSGVCANRAVSLDCETAPPVENVRLNYAADTLPEGKSFRFVAAVRQKNAAGAKGAAAEDREAAAGKKSGETAAEAVMDSDVYISENMLYLKTPLVNDLIYVYTLSGLQIDKFVKDTELFVKDV